MSTVKVLRGDPTTHGEEVRISPLLYDTILIRAERRLLNLHSKVKDAPFLVEQQEALKKFLETSATVSHRASIKACLENNFGLKRFTRIGSFGNGTNVSGYSDVDYLACLPTACRWFH
jgi:hypothetical protein